MSQGYPPPDYIMANWTDELLMLMVDKHSERMLEDNEAAQRKAPDEGTGGADLILRSGGMIQNVAADSPLVRRMEGNRWPES